MAFYRDKHEENYTKINNAYIVDNRLSTNARFLFTFILSLPDDWDFSIRGIAVKTNLNPNTVNKYINELEQYGYIIRSQIHNEHGRFGKCEWNIYEIPKK